MSNEDMSDWGLPSRKNYPYDAPSAVELIHAVEECITEEIIPSSDGLREMNPNFSSLETRRVVLNAEPSEPYRMGIVARFQASST